MQRVALLASAVLVMCGVLASDAEPKPYWPRRFSVAFNETTKLVFSWSTSGTWVYDVDAGVELVRRLNGRGDRQVQGSRHSFKARQAGHVVDISCGIEAVRVEILNAAFLVSPACP